MPFYQKIRPRKSWAREPSSGFWSYAGSLRTRSQNAG